MIVGCRRLKNWALLIGFIFFISIWPIVVVIYTRQSSKLQNSSSESNAIFDLASDLPPEDYEQLIDLHNFDYITQQPPCTSDIVALILIPTAPKNINKRLEIRNTWGSLANAPPLRLIFLLAAVVSNKTLMLTLREENALFNDMVQANFIDDYRNMTYKHVMALKWFSYYCAHAQFLIKVDDDVFLNTPQLLNYIKNETLQTNQSAPQLFNDVITSSAQQKPTIETLKRLFWHPRELLFCHKMQGNHVSRSFRSAWRVSRSEFAGDYFPVYCPGYFIMYSADIVQLLYRAAQITKYFWIDDVHVTGTLAQLANITITSSHEFLMNRTLCNKILAGKTDLQSVKFLVAWINNKQIRQLWDKYNLSYKLRQQLNGNNATL